MYWDERNESCKKRGLRMLSPNDPLMIGIYGSTLLPKSLPSRIKKESSSTTDLGSDKSHPTPQSPTQSPNDPAQPS
jgi:hypothetical protein